MSKVSGIRDCEYNCNELPTEIRWDSDVSIQDVMAVRSNFKCSNQQHWMILLTTLNIHLMNWLF